MTPDALSAESISANLGTSIIGGKVFYYPSVTSTNDVANDAARQGEPEGTAVIADEQTAGKGRIKRTWATPPGGNIAVSIILRPRLSHLPYLVMLASLAVARSIEAVTGLNCQIKWPNDVLIKGKKVCGILAESDVRGDTVNYAVVGIGINVNLNVSQIPEISATATSLFDELGREVSRVALIRRLLVEIDALYLAAPGSVYEQWRDRLVTLGKTVVVRSGETALEGIAESVNQDGSLLLRLPDGSSSTVIAGDVTLRNQL
ncbi:MAG: biotin--[acetyl-CoA-carboxylase] ligase [Dehalococcoidales bacterium]|nr:biotin--[acetyl-CoA-carboxylase] ligase [Dehalococcoidales bacterium]